MGEFERTKTTFRRLMYRVFQYRLPMEGQPDDLNRWMAGHRVVGVKQYLVQSEGSAHLVFVVESSGEAVPEKAREPRVDYKERLSEEDFVVYCRLRDLRKELAQREGVPVYAVFSNAQLAEMVERQVSSSVQLGDLNGIGAGKVERYGASEVSFLKNCWQERTGEG